MGETEAGRVFEAVTEKAVETDMGDPDQGERKKDMSRQQHARGREQQRPNQSMPGIIDDRAGARAAEIAEEAEVWCEKKNGE